MSILAALAVVLVAVLQAGPAGEPPAAGGSAIAAKICVQVQRVVGGRAFQRSFPSLAACEMKAASDARAAIPACLSRYAPQTDRWRRCIDLRIAAAAKSLERHR